MAKAFWPGFQWRILAHKLNKIGRDAVHTGDSIDLHSDFGRPSYPGIQQKLTGAWEFDELVIDDWFHLEQMNERDWWMGVGNGDDYWHINVHIDGKGQASVQIEKQ